MECSSEISKIPFQSSWDGERFFVRSEVEKMDTFPIVRLGDKRVSPSRRSGSRYVFPQWSRFRSVPLLLYFQQTLFTLVASAFFSAFQQFIQLRRRAEFQVALRKVFCSILLYAGACRCKIKLKQDGIHDASTSFDLSACRLPFPKGNAAAFLINCIVQPIA